MILLVAAALGLVGGVVLAEVRLMGDAVPAEDDEPLTGEAEEVMPMGRAMAQADPMAPDEETLEGIAPYPGAAPRKLTSHSSVSGMPMKVSWFSTPDGPAEVLAFYQKAFVADDRMVVTHRFSENIGYVAWTDRNDPPPHGDAGEDDPTPPNPLHMVSVVRQGRDTLVFISKTEPHEFFARPLRLPNGVLLPPSAEPPQVIELAEFSLDRRTIYSRARELSVDETRQFFERELTKAQWSLVDGAEEDRRVSMIAKKGTATQQITLVPDGAHTRILITLDARPAPEMSR